MLMLTINMGATSTIQAIIMASIHSSNIIWELRDTRVHQMLMLTVTVMVAWHLLHTHSTRDRTRRHFPSALGPCILNLVRTVLLGLDMKDQCLLVRQLDKVSLQDLLLVHRVINRLLNLGKDRRVTHMHTHRCKMLQHLHPTIGHFIHHLDQGSNREIIIMPGTPELDPINIIQEPCQGNIHRIIIIRCILCHLGQAQDLILALCHLISSILNIIIIRTIQCMAIRHSIIISPIRIQVCRHTGTILIFHIIRRWCQVKDILTHPRQIGCNLLYRLLMQGNHQIILWGRIHKVDQSKIRIDWVMGMRAKCDFLRTVVAQVVAEQNLNRKMEIGKVVRI